MDPPPPLTTTLFIIATMGGHIDATALPEARRRPYRGSHYCSHLNFKHTVIIRRIVTLPSRSELWTRCTMRFVPLHRYRPDLPCTICTNRSTLLSHYLPLRLSDGSSKRLARGEGHAVTISDFSGVLWSSFVISDFYSDLSRSWFDADIKGL